MAEPDRAALRRLARDVNARLGTWLRRQRQLAGLTQTEMAAALGLSYQQIHKYEAGLNQISAGTLVLLAAELQLDLAELAEACLAGVALPVLPPNARPLDQRLAAQIAALDPAQQQALATLLARLRLRPAPAPLSPEAVGC